MSAPLSGGGAGWGNDLRNVLIFANDNLAAGQYSFVFEDDRCEAKSSLSVARKLISVDKVTEVFILCGQAVMATAKTYRGAGVTVMSPLATPSRISELGVFRTGLSDAMAAHQLAAYMGARHKIVAALTEEDDYAVAFLDDFLRAAREISLKVSSERYLPQQSDFRTQLLRLKALGVEALFLNTQAEAALAMLVKQLHELHFSPRLYGAYLPGSEGFLRMAGQLAEGLVFIDFPGANDLLTAKGKALYAEYLARFGPLSGWSFIFPAAFEGFRAIHLGLQQGVPLEQYFLETKFDGIFGSYSFDSHGDMIGPKHVMRVIRHGQAETVAGTLEKIGNNNSSEWRKGPED